MRLKNLSNLRICRVELCTDSLPFADLLSLHLVTFLSFLVMYKLQW